MDHVPLTWLIIIIRGRPLFRIVVMLVFQIIWAVSPNPATSTVSVNVTQNSLSNNSADVSKSSQQLSFSTINIYDQTGNLKMHRLYNKVKSASLNISDLPTGIYVIEITDGTYIETQKLQILKD